MEVLVDAGIAGVAFVMGVLLSNTVKAWFSKEATVVSTAVKADVSDAAKKVESKL